MSPTRAPGPQSVDDYLAGVPPPFRGLLRAVRKTARAAAPQAEEVISYGMPALRQNGIVVYYAAFRDHCSLFVASPKARRAFAEELRPFAGGKGTVRFTVEHPLPASLLSRIVKARVAENQARRRR